MARPVVGEALNRKHPTIPPKGKAPSRAHRAAAAGEVRKELLDLLPCVLYECSASLEMTYVSPNSSDLLGLRSPELLGNRTFWEERIPREDLPLVTDKITQLEQNGAGSAIHRIVNDAGLPVWVCHGFRSAESDGKDVILGCILPIMREKRLQWLDAGVIARFIHKIGNHFQVLSLVISGLRKSFPESRPTEILEGSLAKAVDLTRAFSEYAQQPTSMSKVDLTGVLNAATSQQVPLFGDKGVALEERLDATLQGASLLADPYLLELALKSVLQNALEASSPNQTVIFEARVEFMASDKTVARVRVSDFGCGISEEKRQQALLPFYSSKNDHEGLGLSMAARFIEMHGGRLSVTSAEGQGTVIDIVLPIDPRH